MDPSARALVERIGDGFAIQGRFCAGEEINSGHINSTYRATYQNADGGSQRYVFQSINREVFRDPYAVMRNVECVTRHIQEKVRAGHGGMGGQTLQLTPAKSGALWLEDDQGRVWRCYNHIEGCVTYDVVATPGQAYQAARAFGSFQNLVSDIDPARLVETIPDFHHTRKRFECLMEAVRRDRCGRLAGVREELAFILRREATVDRLLELIETGEVPRRVAHNDTKINNVMIDAETDEAVCVIDLDTVMPGCALYDFGDLVRTASSTAAEDERDLARVRLELPLFEALAEGYLEATGEVLGEAERDHLVCAGKLLTLEVGMRFLTDFLEGDVYFKIHRDGQNLDRARTQLKLAERIEEQEPQMRELVRKHSRNASLLVRS